MNFVAEIKRRMSMRRSFRAPFYDYVWSALDTFHEKPGALGAPKAEGVKQLAEIEDEVILECQSVYVNPSGEDPEILESLFGAVLPESFMDIYRNFGSVLFVTQGWPVALMEVGEIIEAYEDDSYEGSPELGRFFRFAEYIGESNPIYYGLRKNEFTDAWEVVICDYGLLYNQMIGPEGRPSVVAPSFERWLEERWLERDGKPDYLESRIHGYCYMEALPDGWKPGTENKGSS